MSEIISESTKIEKRLNFKEELPKWKGRTKEQSELPEKIKVGEFDKDIFREDGRKIAELYPSIEKNTEPSVLGKTDKGGKYRNFIIMEKEIFEDPPGKFIVRKELISDPGLPPVERLIFQIEFPDNCESIISFRKENGWWNLHHRYTDPRIRDQGLGSLLLKTAESFLQKMAEQKGEAQKIFVKVAQLDVLCWFSNKGFQPLTKQDRQRKKNIFQAHPGLRLGQDYYVYPAYFPEEAEDPITKKKNSYSLRLGKAIDQNGPTKLDFPQDDIIKYSKKEDLMIAVAGIKGRVKELFNFNF